MATVLIAFIVSLIVVLWLGRDGGIDYDNKKMALGKLAAFYVPLVTLMAAFYFGKARGTTARTSVPLEVFLFAAGIVTLWVITPVFLLVVLFIEDVLVELQTIKPYGDSLALLAFGYYFSKDHAAQTTS
jgi:hypothetical protein